MDSIDGLAGDNILTESLLKSDPLSPHDGVDLVGLPEFIRLDVEHVLVDKKILAQSQLELIRDEIRLVRLDHHLLSLRSVALATFEVTAASSTTSSATIASSSSSLIATTVLSLRSVTLMVARVRTHLWALIEAASACASASWATLRSGTFGLFPVVIVLWSWSTSILITFVVSLTTLWIAGPLAVVRLTEIAILALLLIVIVSTTCTLAT